MKFNGGDLETSGAFSTVTGGDGRHTENSIFLNMEQFVSDRYVDFEIVTDESGDSRSREAPSPMDFM